MARAGDYSTLVAHKTVGQVQSLKAKAKQQQRKVERSRQQTVNQYGTAMSGEVNRVFGPAAARAAVGVKTAASRTGQARTLSAAAAQSEQTYRKERQALPVAQRAALKRVDQEAMPGIVTARTAIKDAEAYAARIGIDMKQMDATARGAILQSIIDQNNQVFMMQAQAQLELQQQKKMFQLQTRMQDKADADAALKAAPQVVNSVSAAMGALVDQASNLSDADKENLAKAATDFATANAVDPTAQGVLSTIALQVFQGADAHMGDNGIVDLGWVRNTTVSQVHSMFPTYSSEPAIASSLSDGVMLGGLQTVTTNPGQAYGGQTIEEGINRILSPLDQIFGGDPLGGAVSLFSGASGAYTGPPKGWTRDSSGNLVPQT